MAASMPPPRLPDQGLSDVHTGPSRELAIVHTLAPLGLRLSGEIDASNVDLLRAALAAHPSAHGPLHLDLSDVLFCDVSGIRAFVAYAENLDGDRRLLLHGLPAQIEKVLNVVGWAESAGLEFCNCDQVT